MLSPSRSISAWALLQDTMTATAEEWRLVQEFIAEQRLAATLGLWVLNSQSRETQRDLSILAKIEDLALRNGWMFGSMTTLRDGRGATSFQSM